jgi:hypothetical protein
VKERRGHCTKTPDKGNKMLPFFGNADAAIKKEEKIVVVLLLKKCFLKRKRNQER